MFAACMGTDEHAFSRGVAWPPLARLAITRHAALSLVTLRAVSMAAHWHGGGINQVGSEKMRRACFSGLL